MENLIKKLAILKADSDMSFRQLSEILGTTEQTVKNYFSGRTKIPLAKISALSGAFNVDVSWLMGENDKEILPKAMDVIHKVVADHSHSFEKKAKASRYDPSNHSARIRSLFGSITDHFQDGIYEMFEVDGSSMEPTLSAGDRLLCRRGSIDDIFDGRVYVLVTNRPNLREAKSTGV